jgi:hypothetical protein
MDPNSSYNLEFWIIAENTRGGKWYCVIEVVDADHANYKNVVLGIVDKFPRRYGDAYNVFYWCHETKKNIPLTNDHDLVQIFAKNEASKCCLMSLAYYEPNKGPPVIPSWDLIAEQFVEPPSLLPLLFLPMHILAFQNHPRHRAHHVQMMTC